MMSSKDALNSQLNKNFLGMWVVIGVSVFALIMLVLIIFSMWLMSRMKTGKILNSIPHAQIPDISKEIIVDQIVGDNLACSLHDCKDSMMALGQLAMSKSSDVDNLSQCSQFTRTRQVAHIVGMKVAQARRGGCLILHMEELYQLLL